MKEKDKNLVALVGYLMETIITERERTIHKFILEAEGLMTEGWIEWKEENRDKKKRKRRRRKK